MVAFVAVMVYVVPKICMTDAPISQQGTVYDFEVESMQGKNVSLAEYKNKVCY